MKFQPRSPDVIAGKPGWVVVDDFEFVRGNTTRQIVQRCCATPVPPRFTCASPLPPDQAPLPLRPSDMSTREGR